MSQINTRARVRERGMEPPRVEDFMRDDGIHRKKNNLKRKPLQEVSKLDNNKENEGESEGVLKKFKMSLDEKHMNGAPEGELYDITVLNDQDLKKLNGSNEEIAASLSQAFANCSAPSSSWADRFATVELLRRITLDKGHASILQNDYVLLVAALESCTHAVGSLRSCSVRNGLLAINALIRTVPLALSYEHGSTLLEALMSGKLLTSGPKFISESTNDLIEAIVNLMDPMVAVKCFALSIEHRNPHVSNLAFSLVAKAVLSVKQTLIDAWRDCFLERSSSSSRGGRDTLHKEVNEVFSVLHRGLSAKRPSGRDLCRKSFFFLKESLGSSFTIVVESCLGQHRAVEIHREISKFIDSDEYNAKNSSDQLYKHGGAIPGRGLSHTVPYHKVNDRLDKTGSKISKHSGQLSSSGRMSVMDQIRADRKANQEKERPATSSSSRSSFFTSANKKPSGGIFIFEDM